MVHDDDAAVNRSSSIREEVDAMRAELLRMEQELEHQRRLAFAAGIFQNDVTVRTLLEAVAEGVVVCDPQGRIVLFNRRAEEMFGYTSAEVTGRSLAIILPERYLDRHAQHMANFFISPHMRPMGSGYDLAGKRKDGSEFPVEVSLSYLETEVGMLGIAFVTDITERKQAEWELKVRNQELDAFAEMVAHDLRGSLQTLVSYAEILREEYDDLSPEDKQQYLGILVEGGQKLANIVDELLIFSSVRRQDVTRQPVDTHSIVRSAINRLRAAIRESGAEIHIPDAFESALGYEPWIEEVWYNYISNAIAHGGAPPRVELGSQREGDVVRFWVRDNGPGLKDVSAEFLFRPAPRLGRRARKGYGIGLSIVRRIIEKLGGEVGATTAPEGGSIFYFTLPWDANAASQT